MQATSSEIKSKVRFKKGLGVTLPGHRNLVRLDKHQCDAGKSKAQARKEPQGTG